MDYNHPRWPSPRAKLTAKKLGLGHHIKRMTHQQALELLAKKAKMSVPEFLDLPIGDAWLAIDSARESYGWSHLPTKIPCDPLKTYRW